ncbi:mite group 2 allergen-like Ixo r 2 [Ixodes scapularis]
MEEPRKATGARLLGRDRERILRESPAPSSHRTLTRSERYGPFEPIRATEAKHVTVLAKDFGDHQLLKSLMITPCDSDPCTFERGESYNATFMAESPEDIEDMHVKLVVQSHTDSFKINMVTWDSCHFVDVPCTVKAGETFMGNVKVPIHKAFSAGKLTVRIEVGPLMKKFACGEFDIVEL